jgi:hypothetical protein
MVGARQILAHADRAAAAARRAVVATAALTVFVDVARCNQSR